MDRRSFVVGTAATAATFVARSAIAQDAYPSRAITMVSPFPSPTGTPS
jgi:tripartite-type tricarboxylate transporter receptor subunit TctC